VATTWGLSPKFPSPKAGDIQGDSACPTLFTTTTTTPLLLEPVTRVVVISNDTRGYTLATGDTLSIYILHFMPMTLCTTHSWLTQIPDLQQLIHKTERWLSSLGLLLRIKPQKCISHLLLQAKKGGGYQSTVHQFGSDRLP